MQEDEDSADRLLQRNQVLLAAAEEIRLQCRAKVAAAREALLRAQQAEERAQAALERARAALNDRVRFGEPL